MHENIIEKTQNGPFKPLPLLNASINILFANKHTSMVQYIIFTHKIPHQHENTYSY